MEGDEAVLACVVQQMKLTAQERGVVRMLFASHADRATGLMPEQGFAAVLSLLGVNAAYHSQFFRAVDRHRQGGANSTLFALALVALDPTTPHDGPAGEQRLRFIFDVYDLNGDGQLDSNEFVHMVRHIRRSNGESTDGDSVLEAARTLAAAMVSNHTPTIGLDQFVAAVKTRRFRGTSRLFRAALSPLQRGKQPMPPPQQLQQQDPQAQQHQQALHQQAQSQQQAHQHQAQHQQQSQQQQSQQQQAQRQSQQGQSHAAQVETPQRREGLVPEVREDSVVATPSRSRRSSAPRSPIQLKLCGVVVSESAAVRPAQQLRQVGVGEAANKKIQHIAPDLVEHHHPNAHPVRALAAQVVQRLLRTPVPSHRSPFTLLTAHDLMQLCEACEQALRSEPTCVSVSAPAKVFGDIHGQLKDLQDLFNAYGTPNDEGDIHLNSYVFIGDFVDRGLHSLEVVALLFSLKTLYPKRVVLLRGNHEDRAVQEQYGFADDCRTRFPTPQIGLQVWERVNRVFDWLPLAAVISDVIFCVHGGLGSNVTSIQQVAAIERPLREPSSHALCADLLWSDPTDSDHTLGVHANARGTNIACFGPDRVRTFCAHNDIKMIIRAHQCVKDGYELFASGYLITVFSATNYCGMHMNDGALVQIGSEGTVQIKVVKARPVEGEAASRWTNVRDVSPLRQPRR